MTTQLALFPPAAFPAAAPRWRTSDALIVAVAGIAGAILPLIATGFADPDLLQGLMVEPRPPRVAVVHGAVAAAWALAMILTARLRGIANGLWLSRCTPGQLGAGVALGVLVAGAPHLLATALTGIPPAAEITPAQTLTVVVPVVLIIPFIEELLFRGVLLGWLSSRMRFAWAAVISSAAFAVIHNPVAGVAAFPIGLVLCWLLRRARSLWPGVALHAAHNLTLVLLVTGPTP